MDRRGGHFFNGLRVGRAPLESGCSAWPRSYHELLHQGPAQLGQEFFCQFNNTPSSTLAASLVMSCVVNYISVPSIQPSCDLFSSMRARLCSVHPSFEILWIFLCCFPRDSHRPSTDYSSISCWVDSLLTPCSLGTITFPTHEQPSQSPETGQSCGGDALRS